MNETRRTTRELNMCTTFILFASQPARPRVNLTANHYLRQIFSKSLQNVIIAVDKFCFRSQCNKLKLKDQKIKSFFLGLSRLGKPQQQSTISRKDWMILLSFPRSLTRQSMRLQLVAL